MKKYLKFTLALIIPALAFGFYMMQPKGPINIAKANAEMEVTASDLYSAFEENEAVANEAYAGKVISVSGLLDGVGKSETGQTQLKVGEEIRFKGVCTGYLFDVVIDHGMLE